MSCIVTGAGARGPTPETAQAPVLGEGGGIEFGTTGNCPGEIIGLEV